MAVFLADPPRPDSEKAGRGNSVTRTLSHRQARAFYDGFGARQDRQGWYEDAALTELIAHADFAQAGRVIEFGCGTGRFAASLLAGPLADDALWLGLDISRTMAGLARDRLRAYADRATVLLTDGRMALPVTDDSVDRVIATYVLDLLSADDCRMFVAEARRVLAPGGLLCLCGLTGGATPLARLVTTVWRSVHAINPKWVGGCRPMSLMRFVEDPDWQTVHHGVVTRRGISSEVLIARVVNIA